MSYALLTALTTLSASANMQKVLTYNITNIPRHISNPFYAFRLFTSSVSSSLLFLPLILSLCVSPTLLRCQPHFSHWVSPTHTHTCTHSQDPSQEMQAGWCSSEYAQHCKYLSLFTLQYVITARSDLPCALCAFISVLVIPSDVSSGSWDTDSCQTLPTHPSHTKCLCDQLSTFAVLAQLPKEMVSVAKLLMMTQARLLVNAVCNACIRCGLQPFKTRVLQALSCLS